eukprot:gnl/TRDRNA2_/TRDRNA2_132878_c0_seq1.p1 gnl/TRDRNA2_/TRDRNA2_132878_c0~~gnl/TRDRNA2_/TRDRNA2_132878_c0_seq1.p1  ORF type:complete len:353 (+),score=80.73 gnl/TRDRNA2_/TRDRNA2_132878_c0_seq1:56-1114(+)
MRTHRHTSQMSCGVAVLVLVTSVFQHSAEKLNIPSTVDDPCYRYKMPPIESRKQGTGKVMLSTFIRNMPEVAEALEREPEVIMQFFSYELNAKNEYTNIPAEGPIFKLSGHHDSQTLQKLIDKFITKFIICRGCKNPETEMFAHRKDSVRGRCKACGWKGDLDNTHKLAGWLAKRLPGEDGEGKKKEKKSKEEKRAARQAAAKEVSVEDDEEEEEEAEVQEEQAGSRRRRRKEKGDAELEGEAKDGDVNEETKLDKGGGERRRRRRKVIEEEEDAFADAEECQGLTKEFGKLGMEEGDSKLSAIAPDVDFINDMCSGLVASACFLVAALATAKLYTYGRLHGGKLQQSLMQA